MPQPPFTNADQFVANLKEKFGKIEKIQEDIILSYFEIGTYINQNAEQFYGAEVNRILGEKLGKGKGVIAKIRQFAQKYSEQDVTELLKCEAQICWRDICQNLSLTPEQMISAANVGTKKEFWKEIAKLKKKENPSKDISDNSLIDVLQDSLKSQEVSPITSHQGKKSKPVYKVQNIPLPEKETGIERFEKLRNRIMELEAENVKLKEELKAAHNKIESMAT